MKLCFKIELIINWFLDVLFPQKCLGCKDKGVILCNYCIIKISLNEREINENIFAVFDYRDDLIKKAIWSLKYHHYRYLGLKLGEILYEAFLEDISDIREYSKGHTIIIIPVPISSTRIKIRGYNQALIIARGFYNNGGKENFELKNNIIIKKSKIIPQTKISNKRDRLKNIHNAFEIKKPELVKGKTIIIIDDVTTTGGTINEIIKILKKSGAKKVIGLAIAH